MALATLVNVLNLPLYVIGGGVVSGWDLFAPRMFEELRRLSYIYGLTSPALMNLTLLVRRTWFRPLLDPMPDCWERLCCPISKLGCFDFDKSKSVPQRLTGCGKTQS